MQIPSSGTRTKKGGRSPSRVLQSHASEVGLGHLPLGAGPSVLSNTMAFPFDEDVCVLAATPYQPFTPVSERKTGRPKVLSSPSYQQQVRTLSPYATVSTPISEKCPHRHMSYSPHSHGHHEEGLLTRDKEVDAGKGKEKRMDRNPTPPAQHHHISTLTASSPLAVCRGQIIATVSTSSRLVSGTPNSQIGNTTPKKGSNSSYSTPKRVLQMSSYQSSPQPVAPVAAAPAITNPKDGRGGGHNPGDTPRPSPSTPLTASGRTSSRGHPQPATTTTTAADATAPTATVGIMKRGSHRTKRDESQMPSSDPVLNPIPIVTDQTQRRVPMELQEKGGRRVEHGQVPKINVTVTTPLRKKKSVTVTGKSPAGLKGSRSVNKKRVMARSSPVNDDLCGNMNHSLPISTSASISCIRRVEDDDELSASTASSWGWGLSGKLPLSQSAGSSLWEGELQQMSLLEFEENEEKYREEEKEEEFDRGQGEKCATSAFAIGSLPMYDQMIDMGLHTDVGVEMNKMCVDFGNMTEQSRIFADSEMSQSKYCLGDSFYLQQSLPYDISLLSLQVTDTDTDTDHIVDHFNSDMVCLRTIHRNDEDVGHVLFNDSDIVAVDSDKIHMERDRDRERKEDRDMGILSCNGDDESDLKRGDNSMQSVCSSSTESVTSTLRILRRLNAAGVDQCCFSPLTSIKSIDFSSSCLIEHSPSFDLPLSLPSCAPSNPILLAYPPTSTLSPTMDADCLSLYDEIRGDTRDSPGILKRSSSSDYGSDSTFHVGSDLNRGFLCDEEGPDGNSSISGSNSNSTAIMIVRLDMTMMTNTTAIANKNENEDKEDENENGDEIQSLCFNISSSHPNSSTHRSFLSSTSNEQITALKGNQMAERKKPTGLLISPHQNSKSSEEGVEVVTQNKSLIRDVSSSLPPSPVSLDIPCLSNPESALSPKLPHTGPSLSFVPFSPSRVQTQRLDAYEKAVDIGKSQEDTRKSKVRVSKYARSDVRTSEGGTRSGEDILFTATTSSSSSFLSTIPYGEERNRNSDSRGVYDRGDSRDLRCNSPCRSLSPPSSLRYISMDSFGDSGMGQRPFCSSSSSVSNSFSLRSHSTSPVPGCLSSTAMSSSSPYSTFSHLFSPNRFKTSRPLSQSVKDFLAAEAETQDQLQIEAKEASSQSMSRSSQSTSCSTSILNKVSDTTNLVYISLHFPRTTSTLSSSYHTLPYHLLS